jgi:hypothetical protein
MCNCTKVTRIMPHIELPKPGVFIGEKGLELVEYTGEYDLVEKVGEVTKVSYRFARNVPRYVDKRDTVFLIDGAFQYAGNGQKDSAEEA